MDSYIFLYQRDYWFLGERDLEFSLVYATHIVLTVCLDILETGSLEHGKSHH